MRLKDNITDFVGVISKYKLPEYVLKEASENSLDKELDDLPHSLFAHPLENKYPINSKANTALSWALFKEARDEIEKKSPVIAEEIERNIEKGCKLWGVEPLEERQKPDKPVHSFMIKHASENIQNYELAQGYYKDAVDDFMRKRKIMSYDMRRSYAQGLLSAPENIKEDISKEASDFLRKSAGDGCSTVSDLESAISERVELLPKSETEAKKILMDFIYSLEDVDTPLVRGELLEKATHLFDLIDRSSGISKHYEKGLHFPEEAAFAVPEKLLKDSLKNVVSVNDLHLTPADIDETGDIINEILQSVMDKDIPEDGPKSVLLDLSDPEKKVFVELYSSKTSK